MIDKHKVTFGDDGCVHYLHRGDGFTAVYIGQNVKLGTLKMYHLLCVNYGSIKLFRIKTYLKCRTKTTTKTNQTKKPLHISIDISYLQDNFLKKKLVKNI